MILGYTEPLKVSGPRHRRWLTIRKIGSHVMKLKDLQIVRLPHIEDNRGSLVFAEVEQLLPFTPKRFFVVHNVPSNEIRGEHAHKKLHEFVVALKGSVKIKIFNSESERLFELTDPTMGLHIPPKTWRVLYEYSADAILLVLASDKYDPDDYIRDIEEFRRSQFE